MNKMIKFKKRLNLLACAVIVLALAFSCLCLNLATTVKAEEPDDYTTITVNDGQFSQSGSGLLSKSPNWTGSSIGEFDGSGVISGVIDLSASSVGAEDFMEKTGLSSFPEYEKSKPVTPFGRDEKLYPGTNTKVLLINTHSNADSNSKGTAYGYASDAVSLASNSFYKFTAWVKTGKFVQDRGAVIKISGLEHDVGFWNIDTSDIDVKSDKTNGFREFKIYVATSVNTVSAVINLQVGDSYIFGDMDDSYYMEKVTPSDGYALFDNVTCTRLTANAFYEETAIKSDYIEVYDADADATGIIHRRTVTSFENGISDLKKGYNENVSDSGTARYVDTYDAGIAFDEQNKIGLAENPYTYKGTTDYIDGIANERDILVIKAEKEANVYVETKDITIEANKFYRLGVWAKTEGFESSSNASLVIVGEDNIPSHNFEMSPAVINDISGSSDPLARYGWNRYSFYLRGSYSKDCKVRLQLWLGYSSNCTGTVFYDDVVLEQVSYDYYNNNYTSGTEVRFDAEPSTSIDNGRFFQAESYSDECLWKPVQWTGIGTVPQKAASGIILTNDRHYEAHKGSYFNVENPVSQTYNTDINAANHPSMLLLATGEQAHFGYASPSIAIDNGEDYKISVTLYVKNMTGSGANLWLEVNNIVIASVKNIMTTNNNFQTFDFYVQGDEPFTSGTGTDYTATLKIAMGREDAMAAGSIYVAEAAMTTLDDGEFASKLNEYKTDRRFNPTYDMYSFSSFDFFGYDNTDKNAIKKTTNWSISSKASNATEGENYNLKYGVFDPHNKDDNLEGWAIPDEITYAYDALQNKFGQVFALQVRDTAVTAQLINPIKLEADSYYMVTVNMAVIIKDELGNLLSKGAGISLAGDEIYSDANFTDLTNTYNFEGELEFRPYQFYIASSDATATLYLRVSLGDDAYTDMHVTGDIYIANISVVNLGASDDTLENSDTLKIIDNHVLPDEEGDEPDTDTDTDSDDTTTTSGSDSEKWWLIPSILFGVAIVLAVVGSIIRTIIDKSSRKQRRKQLNSYDRRYGIATPDEEDTTRAFDDNETAEPEAPVIEQEIDAFDDDEPEKTKPSEEPKPTEEAPADETNEKADNKETPEKADDKEEKPAVKAPEKNNGDVNDDFDD